MTNRILPRAGAALKIKAGQTFTVVDPQGMQVSDMVAFALEDHGEVISNGGTFDFEETIALTTGSTLWSNRSRKKLMIERDDVGRHDFLLTPCSRDTFIHFYPDKPVHSGCFGNLASALAPFGISSDRIPTAFNIFMNVTVSEDGAISVQPPISRAGDMIRFRACMDLIVGLTACSAYASNGGSFKPIDYFLNSE
ncbi:DUF1989 domain-containing protein [Erythrobacter sp. R86502]|uniref:DUF1989 domain-containing protein n=1 Tax=Erythrobacter sp. R86502 TaxID=3093846 RepID=UPI0036D299DB